MKREHGLGDRFASVVRRTAGNLMAHVAGFRFFGSAFWVAWILLIYSTEFIFGPVDVHSYNAICFFVSTLSVSLTYLFLGINRRAGSLLLKNKAPVFVAGVAASAGTGLVVAAPCLGEASMPLCVVGNVMTGVGTGCISMRCAILYGELSARRAFITTFIMGSFGMLIYSAALTFPRPLSVAVLVALPICAALPTFADDTPDKIARAEGSFALIPAFYRLVAVVFLLSFVLTISRGLYPNALMLGQFDESRGVVSFASLVLGIVMVTVSCAVPREALFGKVVLAVLLVSALILLLMPLASPYSAQIGIVFSSAFILLGYLVWALLGAITSITGLSPLRVFGFGFLAYLLGAAFGWPFGQIVNDLNLLANARYVVALVVLVVLTAVCILLGRDFSNKLFNPLDVDEREGSECRESFETLGAADASGVACGAEARVCAPSLNGGIEEDGGVEKRGCEKRGLVENGEPERGSVPPGEAGEAAPGTYKARWRLALARLAEDNGLTQREEEVLVLMSKGRSARFISNELGISYNTARTHVRNIYAKIGVHSHGELVSVIEEQRGI